MKTTKRKIIFTIPFLILIFQCITDKNSVGTIDKVDDGKLSIRTSKVEYWSSQKIEFALSNFTDSTAYVHFCGDELVFIVEKKVNGVWEGPVHPPICLPSSLRSFGIEPGHYLSSAHCANLKLSNSGAYRLRVKYDWMESLVLDSTLYSNVFIVKLKKSMD